MVKQIFEEEVKSYKERIERLKKLDSEKEEEIEKLKTYIFEFHNILIDLKQLNLPLSK